ncbi:MULTISPECIES: hypothetical protein [Kitasatospora]|uniref:Secreted protein n=1 Tax=Kitasatospora setae (strain ATCC 33774 / DSM 43861 / JCM 3304 / KCC A-0304 / NBRC 14216 / KM-6054) TaxID=452652 RepID=E4NB21_KITSK|nr:MULTISPECIES: hypothetical protein [Kitasatospora]BAJ28402.1 hypothetical protein KSE_25890 [Kitasatospora setae KM-6054]
MEALGVVMALVALFGVALLVMAVVGTVKAAKAVAAKVDRHSANAQRAMENAALKAKSFAKPGEQGRIAALRLSLRTSLDSTRQVLQAGLPQDGQLTDALQLLARLDSHAGELDTELRMLEREPMSSRVTAKLPELRERAERITHSADSLRWAAQDRIRRFADDELARLGKECQDEAGALRHWTPADPGGSAADRAAETPAAGTDSPGTAASSAEEPADRRKGLGSGRPSSAEELLGLAAEPLSRLADRLRKPNPAGPNRS